MVKVKRYKKMQLELTGNIFPSSLHPQTEISSGSVRKNCLTRPKNSFGPPKKDLFLNLERRRKNVISLFLKMNNITLSKDI